MLYTPSIFIKYVVLSFLQEKFKEDPKYTWKKNPKDTNIVIADKYAMELGIAAKRPSIILDRGSLGWTMNYRNEAFPTQNSLVSGKPQLSKLSKDRLNYQLKDLMRGSATLTVVDKTPYRADEIANIVFNMISGYRELFKKKGIHKYSSLRIGKESIMKAGSDIEVSAVPISFQFIWEQTIRLAERLYNCKVYLDDEQVYENQHFIVKQNGTQIEFANPVPDDVTPSIDYIEAITLNEVTNKNLIPVNGSNTLYVVPDNGAIYGYHEILSKVILEEDSNTWTQVD